MNRFSGRRRAWTGPVLVLGLLLATARAGRPAGPDGAPGPDLVAVSILREGRAVLLATPGIPSGGRLWRFRSLDTSALPQPIRRAWLSASGTKLFVQPAGRPGVVIDLTRQHRPGGPLQYIDPQQDLASGGVARGQSHRLPFQRFVSVRDGTAFVIDDRAAAQSEYSVLDVTDAAISDDGAVLVIRSDRTVAICGEVESSRSSCRELPARVDPDAVRINARAVPPRGAASPGRFLLVTGAEDRAYVIDPEQNPHDGPAMRLTEAALRACLALHQLSMSDRQVAALADALSTEAAQTSAASHERVTGWQFFRVTPDEALYAPILQFARRETVFPAAFETLEELRAGMPNAQSPSVEALYDRYVRLEPEDRKRRCTLYFRTHSRPGSWLIEYWTYYPFDVGGFFSHLHDPEHFFVEVDKLGGAVRRVIATAHGYFAGNNIYLTDYAGALPVDLPLFAMVEMGKHATAPDVDRDGVFTPGIDENEYGERAKIWGVRDVIGTINNQFLAYDSTMSAPRRLEDCLAPTSVTTRFPNEPGLAAHAWCRLEPVPEGGPPPPACHEATTECAKAKVILHQDFGDLTTALKSWFFPDSFLRVTYGYGPSQTRHSVGLGYAVDLDRMRGLSRIMPLPGRIGAEIFGWHQDVALLSEKDYDACIADCEKSAGVGWGIRYEQFFSNIFGIFSSVRFYTPPISDVWISFGPMVEMTLFNHSNVNVQGGLAFQPVGSPRFDLRVTVGLWKPRTKMVGMKAGSDHR